MREAATRFVEFVSVLRVRKRRSSVLEACLVETAFAHGAFAEMVMGRLADEPDDHEDSQGERP